MIFKDGFLEPEFRRNMLGIARNFEIVSALVDGVSFVGRVVNVGVNDFELALISPVLNLPAGSIVNISFSELGALSVI